jgi:hypothetical protein
MINKKTTFLILAFLFALISIPIIGNRLEGFGNLNPGAYPLSVDKPLLDDYPLKDKMGVSANTAEKNYQDYSIYGSSQDPYMNNVRYWETPENGLCSRPEFCGGLYNSKKIDIPKTPNPISFSSPQLRVNFYGSHKLVCPG